MDKNTKSEKMEKDTAHNDVSSTQRVRHTRRPIQNPEMKIDRKCDRDYEENTVTFGVTEIDEKFDLSFDSYSFMLNKKQFWDDLVEALKQYPCYKRMSTCGTDVFDKYVFKVPIKEQKTISYHEEEFREEHWVKYNGEYYDPSKIYVVEYEDCDEKEIRNNIRSIRAVCDQKLAKPFMDNTKIEFIGLCECQYPSVQRNLVTQYALSNCFTKTNEVLINKSHARYFCSNNSYPECIDINPGEIVFDMKNLANITHLGILPPPIRTQKARLRNSKDAYLVVASNLSKQSWISNFKIWYKVNGSDNWVYLNEYRGNDNCYSMNLIDLSSEYNTNDGLQCRYLKVVVSSYHINPGFRLAVYGKQIQKVVSDAEKEKVTEKKDKYIEYTIEFPANNTKALPDGKVWNDNCRYWGKNEHPNRTRAKMTFMKQLKHGEFDDVGAGDNSDGYDYDDDNDNESVYSWNSYWTCSGCGGVRSELSDDDDDYDVIDKAVEYPGALRQFMDATNRFWYG